MTQPVLSHVALSPGELAGGDTPHGIGLVAPFDFALDAECWRWLPPDIPLFITRTPRQEISAVTVEMVEMLNETSVVQTAVGSVLAARPAAVAYACTSASFVNGMTGEQQLQTIMRTAGAPAAVTSSGALLAALTYLGVRTVAIATPYNQALTERLVTFLHEGGFAVVSSGFLNLEAGIAKVGPEAVRAMARAIDVPEAEALFFSCTNLRTFGLAQELEAELGKPVLSANQVTLWAALKAGGMSMPAIPMRLFS